MLYDTTTGTWWLRHLARAFVQLAIPLAGVLLFIPGPFYIRWLGALSGVFRAPGHAGRLPGRHG